MVMGVEAWGEVTRRNFGFFSRARSTSACHTASTAGSATSSAPRSSHRRNRRWEKIFQPSTTSTPASHTAATLPTTPCGMEITHRGGTTMPELIAR